MADGGLIDTSSEVAAMLRHWRLHPVDMVWDVFKVKELDWWQGETLTCFPTERRIALIACKGPGKTATLTWCGWNFLLCYDSPKVVGTSITGDNLQDGMWSEMSKWQQRSPLLTQAFKWTKTRIEARHAPANWWMSARTWAKSANPEEQANTMAGLHDDNILVLLDEVSDYPDGVVVAADAILANADAKEGLNAHLLIAGNPTRKDGPLYRAHERRKSGDPADNRGLWKVINITGDPDDPRRASRVSKEWAQDLINEYGRDHSWVMVNVLGQFPNSALNSLLSHEEVTASMARPLPDVATLRALPDARIVGADVARWGDDENVLARRVGMFMFPLEGKREINGIQGAAWVEPYLSQFFGGATDPDATKYEADAAMVDGTGGYGSSWIDQLGADGRSPYDVQFAGAADNPAKFGNKRAEMYWRLAEAVKAGLKLPDCNLLKQELVTMRYYYVGDRIFIEDKKQVKARLGRSPDRADAVALTFAFLIPAKSRDGERGLSPHLFARAAQLNRERASASGAPKRDEYDIGARMEQVFRGTDDYDPFREDNR